MDRKAIADLILGRVSAEMISLKDVYRNTQGSIGYFVIDDLLPEDLALRLYQCFPRPDDMMIRRSLREHKFVAAQMDRYDGLLEEALFAFQDERIVDAIMQICGCDALYPDENLYAGGISLMGKGHFLNPHLDNSHDKDRNKWRTFNLLYYVTPAWSRENGGNLELWPDGPKKPPITVVSQFNRLVVMATHQASWHSVSPVAADSARMCISNYYFSDSPLKENDQFHVTSFRGRPDQKIRDLILRLDLNTRQAIRKVFPKGVAGTKHIYRKGGH